MMINKTAAARSTVVRLFKALIFILGAFCLYVVGGSLVGLLRNPYPNLSPWVNRSLWLDSLLTALIALVVLYQLFRLAQMVVKGEPFNPVNPSRIRAVAWAVLAISVSNLAFTALRYSQRGYFPGHDWSIAANILIKGTERVFVILGLLIIAKLLDTGVRLQQDQNLTV